MATLSDWPLGDVLVQRRIATMVSRLDRVLVRAGWPPVGTGTDRTKLDLRRHSIPPDPLLYGLMEAEFRYDDRRVVLNVDIDRRRSAQMDYYDHLIWITNMLVRYLRRALA